MTAANRAKKPASLEWEIDFPSPRLPGQTAAGHIARELAQIRKLLRQPLETEIAKGNLTGPQRAVMQVVVRNPGVNLRDLSAQIGLAQSTVSGIVDRLAKHGMVERRADPSDGRGTRIHPTHPVVQFLQEKMPHLAHDPLQQALANASEQEIAEIQSALSRLRKLLEEAKSAEAS